MEFNQWHRPPWNIVTLPDQRWLQSSARDHIWLWSTANSPTPWESPSNNSAWHVAHPGGLSWSSASGTLPLPPLSSEHKQWPRSTRDPESKPTCSKIVPADPSSLPELISEGLSLLKWTCKVLKKRLLFKWVDTNSGNQGSWRIRETWPWETNKVP